MDRFDRLATESELEDPIMSLLSQQYGGQQAAATPVVGAAASYSPVSQAAQVSADPQSVAAFASRFQNELSQLGWTGGDPVVYDYTPGGESGQDFRATAVGVSPEFQQFMQGKNLQIALDPSGGGYRVSLLASGQPIGQYQESQSGFERFMNVAQPLLVGGVLAMTVAGAIAPALAAVPGIPASSVGALSRAIAPTVVQAAATGDFNIEQAARNVVVALVAPKIGADVAKSVANNLFQVADIDMPTSVQRAISNSVASAVATSLQQGADASDIGRNMIAGGVASAVTTTLRSVGLDPAVAAGIGRSAGSYVSTGSGTQAVVDGITRGLTFEQQRQAVADERAARANDPTASQQPSAGSVEQSAPVQDSGAAQTVTVTGEAGIAGVSDSDVQAAIARDRGVSGTGGVQQVTTTGERDQTTAGDVISGVTPAGTPATTAAQETATSTGPTTGGTQQVVTTGTRGTDAGEDVVSGVAGTGATGTGGIATGGLGTGGTAGTGGTVGTGTQTVQVTGQRETGTGVSDQDVVSQISAGQPVTTTAPTQQVEVTGARPGRQNDEEQFARIGPGVSKVGRGLFEEPTPGGGVQTIQIAGEKIQEGPSDEEVYQQLMSERQPVTEPAPAPYGLIDRPSIPVTGARETGVPRPEDLQTGVMQAGEPAQSITIAGAREPDRTKVKPEDLQTTITTTGQPAQQIEIIGAREPQTIDVTGQRISDQDIIDYISTDAGVAAEPAPAPAPAAAPVAAPAPAPSGGVTPTDIFSFVRRGRPTPMTVARLASMDFPMGRTVGTGGFTPAGELEPGGSTRPRQPVWNEASLRLKDALGL